MEVQIIHFELDDRASEALIESMMDDSGIEGDEIRAAVDQFARTRINEDDGLEMGELEEQSQCFAWGYEQAMVSRGEVRPDGVRTFRPVDEVGKKVLRPKTIFAPEVTHKESVDSITRLKAFYAGVERIPQLEPGSVPQELLTQLKRERNALRRFDSVAPVVSGGHYLARCYAYEAYRSMNELVGVYDQAEK